MIPNKNTIGKVNQIITDDETGYKYICSCVNETFTDKGSYFTYEWERIYDETSTIIPTKVSELENDEGYISETELNEIIEAMANGSVAYVNFTHGHKATPESFTVLGGTGIITKLSNNRATLIVSDNSRVNFNAYFGIWFKTDSDEVKWFKIGSQEQIEEIKSKYNLLTYSHYTQLVDYGIANTDIALDFIKKLPAGSTYEGNLYQEFAPDILSTYGGIGKVTKLKNNMMALIEIYDANPLNNKKWIGKYHSEVADAIVWYTYDLVQI